VTFHAVSVVGLLLFLLLFGMPVGFALLVSGSIGLLWITDPETLLGVMEIAPYEEIASFSLSAIPMFILMAEFLTAGKFTESIFSAFHRWLGHLRGGLISATVGGGVMLAAISGSSSASAGTLSSAAYPEMKRLGYDDGFSTGALAIVGTPALLIPPSIGLILYGIMTETSVKSLLQAGILPGILTACGYLATIYWRIKLNPDIAPIAQVKFSRKDKLRSLGNTWPVIVLMLLIFVMIYGGIVTPTEAGASGALLACLLGIFKRTLDFSGLQSALVNAVRISAMIFAIIIGSSIFGVFLTLTGVAQDLILSIEQSGLPTALILLAVLALYILLGFFLDQLAIIILTLPLVFPLMSSLDFNAVWLGIIIVKTAEIGLVSPPMGLNVFIVSNITRVSPVTVFRGVLPFLLMDLVVLALLVIFPDITLYIPQSIAR